MQSDRPEPPTGAQLLDFAAAAGRGNRSGDPGRPIRLVTDEHTAGGGFDVPDTLIHVVGTRADIIKMAPVISALERRKAFRQVIVHTGPPGELFADLELPGIDHALGVEAGSPAFQTAEVLTGFEDVLVRERPVAVVVVGDADSTLASALAAAKLGIPVAHVEAGLRSGDWSMPEEINRVLTDRLSDVLFTHSPDGLPNLLADGIGEHQVHFVGNTLIDTLRRNERRARARAAWDRAGVRHSEYVLVALQQPANVDDPVTLARIVAALVELAAREPVVFLVHPRAHARLADGGRSVLEDAGVRCFETTSYLDVLSLQGGAGAIVTDSGEFQEEAAALGVCCFTFRAFTERPETVSRGTNVLLGDEPHAFLAVRPSPFPPTPCVIPLWDGNAGERIADALVTQYALVSPTAIGAR